MAELSQMKKGTRFVYAFPGEKAKILRVLSYRTKPMPLAPGWAIFAVYSDNFGYEQTTNFCLEHIHLFETEEDLAMVLLGLGCND